jgi:hypothetical protein
MEPSNLAESSPPPARAGDAVYSPDGYEYAALEKRYSEGKSDTHVSFGRYEIGREFLIYPPI